MLSKEKGDELAKVGFTLETYLPSSKWDTSEGNAWILETLLSIADSDQNSIEVTEAENGSWKAEIKWREEEGEGKSKEDAIADLIVIRNNYFLCIDCGQNTSSSVLQEYYMLKDELWNKINPEREGMLCIDCAERRLGRKLTPSDFADLPVNTLEFGSKSERLRSRLGL